MKRAFDIVCSLILLIILLPVFILISAMIYFDSGKPVIFKQKRVGRHKSYFTIYKFRTMKVGTPEKATDQIEHKYYVTKVGKWLRKSSLDELPQLINILKGDMSFVGPRPALFNQYQLIELREKAGIHQLRPGITGLAQIKGRDELSDVEKVKWDQEYLKHASLITDLKIIMKTVFAVFSFRSVKG